MHPCSPRADRRRPRLAVLLVPLLVASAATARQLDLPTARTAPRLGAVNYVSTLSERLAEEVDQLAVAERGAGDGPRAALRAMIDVRLLADLLLTRGAAEGDDGATVLLAGLRLAHGRHLLDARIKALMEDSRGVRAVVDAGRRFDDVLLEQGGALRDGPLAAVERAAATAIAPLSALVDPAPVAHWPRRAVVERRDGAPSVAAADAATTLVARIDAAASALAPVAISEAGRAAVTEALELARRGAAHPAFHDAIDQLLAGLEVAASLDAAVRAAEAWLDPDAAAAYRRRAGELAVELCDPPRRDEALSRVERMRLSARALERLQALAGDRAVLRPLLRTLMELDGNGSRPASDGAHEIARLMAIVDAMATYRARRADREIPRAYAATGQALERLYRIAERTLVDEIDRLASDPRSLGDPGFLSLLTDQAGYVADLDRLERLDALHRQLALHAPRANATAATRLRQLAATLPDPGRRAAARRELDALERDVAACSPFPGEARLSAPDATVIELSAGVPAEVLAQMQAARTEWIERWARGDDAAALRAVVRDFVAYGRALEDAELVAVLESEGRVLQRWSGWEVPELLVERGLNDLPTRVRIASAVAARGDAEGLAAQVAALRRDMPLVRLYARLSERLRPQLTNLPENAAGVVGRLAFPPTGEAWWSERRAALARVCRMIVEADFAVRAGDEALGRACAAWAAEEAGELLDVLEDGGG